MGIAVEMKELTSNIASSHKDRMKSIGDIREEVKEVKIEARDMIHSFEDSREETSRQLRRDLSRGTAERQSEVKNTLEGAQKLIREFRSSRQNVSYQLRTDLGRSLAKAKSEVGKLLEDAQSLVKDFQTSRREASSKLRRDLAQSRANMESDVKQMQKDFREARRGVRADLREAKATWQALAGTIKAGKGGPEIPLEAEAPVAEEGNPDIEANMLAAIGKHPEGITLVGIADGLGVAPVVLGRASKSLLKKREIRKEEKLYFPVTGESEVEQRFHSRPPLR